MYPNFDITIEDLKVKIRRRIVRELTKAGKPVEFARLVNLVYGDFDRRDRRFHNEDMQALVTSGFLTMTWNDYGDSFLSLASK